MTHPKIKRFGKRIEGFFVRIKQRAIVHHLLHKSGGAEVVAAYAGAQADDGEPIAADAPVWICWWQGEDFHYFRAFSRPWHGRCRIAEYVVNH